ncbi:MAG: hypothetical protein OXC40_07710, partial [Proteobacteria bacterium]|nr:hypothetical protein [Pseudomonadota bacterium]
MNLDVLWQGLMASDNHDFQGIAKYPPCFRDLAFIVDESVTYAATMEAIMAFKNQELKYLTHVTLFDVYRSAQLGEQRKSLAFSLTFSSDCGTLNDREVDLEMNRLTKHLESHHGFSMRSL